MAVILGAQAGLDISGIVATAGHSGTMTVSTGQARWGLRPGHLLMTQLGLDFVWSSMTSSGFLLPKMKCSSKAVQCCDS